MTSLPLIALALVFGIAILAVIIAPLLEMTFKSRASFLDDFEQLHYEREILLENLKDLEEDLQLHKISTEDHAELRARLLRQAGSVYSQIAALEARSEIFQRIQRDLQKEELEWRNSAG